eukprot:Cvel_4569.t2-p1 / transcript=Cvel_4569.t2 / gene=Cvel_4569 / organism=Chromera_velia_CCMP2878 / gene_product=hypothetical protein / transcript_product=hypothetical protein / location=Cvel_scaffold200:102847-104825(+) / protein_length=479 / sequence_SO=supercontig / SO=protein_coding / is_pseudo=false
MGGPGTMIAQELQRRANSGTATSLRDLMAIQQQQQQQLLLQNQQRQTPLHNPQSASVLSLPEEGPMLFRNAQTVHFSPPLRPNPLSPVAPLPVDTEREAPIFMPLPRAGPVCDSVRASEAVGGNSVRAGTVKGEGGGRDFGPLDWKSEEGPSKEEEKEKNANKGGSLEEAEQRGETETHKDREGKGEAEEEGVLQFDEETPLAKVKRIPPSGAAAGGIPASFHSPSSFPFCSDSLQETKRNKKSEEEESEPPPTRIAPPRGSAGASRVDFHTPLIKRTKERGPETPQGEECPSSLSLALAERDKERGETPLLSWKPWHIQREKGTLEPLSVEEILASVLKPPEDRALIFSRSEQVMLESMAVNAWKARHPFDLLRYHKQEGKKAEGQEEEGDPESSSSRIAKFQLAAAYEEAWPYLKKNLRMALKVQKQRRKRMERFGLEVPVQRHSKQTARAIRRMFEEEMELREREKEKEREKKLAN